MQSRIAISAVLASMVVAAAGNAAASDFWYRLKGGIGVHAEQLTLSHDASGFNPLLGNPTSTLAYAPLVTVLPQIGLEGENGSGDWFDFLLQAAPLADGTFIDSDYDGDNSLSSETLSGVGIGGAVAGELRFSLPYRPGWSFQGAPVQPYAVLHAGHRRLSALGIACGRICPPLPSLGPDVAIIDQSIWSGAAGIGLQTALPLASGDTLTLGADLSAGYTTVADSHNLRPDLGPTPNILYDFATIGAEGHIGYVRRLAESLELDLGLDVGATAGFGTARFGPRSPTPAGPFPATLTDIGATLTAGLSGRF